MSSEKPDAGKPVQQLLEGFIIMQNVWIQSRAPVVVFPTEKSRQMYLYHSETKNMADSAEDEEPQWVPT